MEETTIFFEFELNPQNNSQAAELKHQRNEETFFLLKSILLKEIPNIKVIQVFSQIPERSAANSSQGQNDLSYDPFEIYVANQLVYSKRKLGEWPHVAKIIPLIKRAIKENFIRSKIVNQDFSAQSNKTHNQSVDIEPKLPFLKTNVNHRAQARKSRAKQNKPLDLSMQNNLIEENGEPQPIGFSQTSQARGISNILRPGTSEKPKSPFGRRLKINTEHQKRAESQPSNKKPEKETPITKLFNSTIKAIPSPYLQPHHSRGRNASYGGGDSSSTLIRNKGPQQPKENIFGDENRGRARNIVKLACYEQQSIGKLLGTSNQKAEGIATKPKRAKLKSVSIPRNAKNESSLSQTRTDYFKEKYSIQNLNHPMYRVKPGIKRVNSTKVGHISCVDDDSSSGELNSMIVESHLLRKTEGDESEDPYAGVRATADFGQGVKEFLSQSLPITKVLNGRSSQKSMSRYSDISIEVDEYNGKNTIEVHDSILSFGGRKSLEAEKSKDHKDSKSETKISNHLNRFMKNKNHDYQSTEEDSKVDAGSLPQTSENNESSDWEKYQKEQEFNKLLNNEQTIFQKNLLGLEERNFNFTDQCKTLQQKRSTPHFAPSKNQKRAY